MLNNIINFLNTYDSNNFIVEMLKIGSFYGFIIIITNY